jgi:hypothetical protein
MRLSVAGAALPLITGVFPGYTTVAAGFAFFTNFAAFLTKDRNSFSLLLRCTAKCAQSENRGEHNRIEKSFHTRVVRNQDRDYPFGSFSLKLFSETLR